MVLNSSSVKAKNYYTYSASGVKLKTEQRYDPNYSITPLNTTNPANDGLSDYKNTDYVGNIIYESEKTGTTLINRVRILVDGGYYENGVCYFYLTDHLGNNRAVFTQDCVLAERTHYYPFGQAFAEGLGDGVQPYKYNGKELDKMHGLNMYDYSARHYDAALGRFTTIDPLAEKFYSESPYIYVSNNPLKYIDPTGREKLNGLGDGSKGGKGGFELVNFGRFRDNHIMHQPKRLPRWNWICSSKSGVLNILMLSVRGEPTGTN